MIRALIKVRPFCSCLQQAEPHMFALTHPGVENVRSRHKLSDNIIHFLDKENRLKGAEKSFRKLQEIEIFDDLYAKRRQMIDNEDLFVKEETKDQLFDGVRFDELPIVHVKTSLTDTVMTLTNHTGREVKLRHSCEEEGFKDDKKATAVASQTTAFTFGKRAVRLGVKNVRLLVRGVGVNKLDTMKGMTMAGMNIISITDNTPIPFNGNRPRKVPRY